MIKLVEKSTIQEVKDKVFNNLYKTTQQKGNEKDMYMFIKSRDPNTQH